MSQLPLPFVPGLLDDELLYSWFGRVVGLNALGPTRDAIELLCGSRQAMPVTDLPAHLGRTFSRMGGVLPFSDVDELIAGCTAYPYHRAFLTPERDERVRAAIVGDSGTGLKTLIGRVANRFGANPVLRFCPICAAMDLRRCGVFYWHRTHQLPGVTACPDHSVLLISCTEGVRDRREFVLVPRRSLECTAISLQCGSWELRFAKLSSDLLRAQIAPVPGPLRSFVYQAALRERFDLGRGDKICFAEVASAMRLHFDDFGWFGYRDRLLSTDRTPLAWVRSLTLKPATAVHPVCHLLLIDYLFGSVDAYVERIKNASRDLADASDVVTPTNSPQDAVLPQDRSGFWVDQTISCSNAATHIGVSVSTVVQHRLRHGIPVQTRPKVLLPPLVARIEHDLRDGLGVAAIARLRAVSESSVYRIRAVVGEVSESQTRAEELRARQRESWTQALKTERQKGVLAARTHAPAAYAWLYRHDREWLLKKNKRLSVKPTIVSRVDWMQRDFLLADAVERIAARAQDDERRGRITKTGILEEIGDTLIRNNLHRLPLLAKSLNLQVETTLEHRIRRIKVAASLAARDGRPLAVSRIRREAGCRVWSIALWRVAESYVEKDAAKSLHD